jgi:hypothetical protein
MRRSQQLDSSESFFLLSHLKWEQVMLQAACRHPAVPKPGAHLGLQHHHQFRNGTGAQYWHL